MKSQAQPPSRIAIDELESFALEELKLQHLRDNIILELCQRMNWDWQQAQHFLDKVYADHHSELATREKRLALLVSFTTILEGVGVFALGSLGLLWWFFYNPRTQSRVPALDDQIVLRVLMLLAMAPAYFGFFFIVAATGVGIMTKGIMGIIRTIW